MAHLVGYVGEVSEHDLDTDRFPGAQLGTVVGRAGLEQEYDEQLRGRPGIHYVEVNARGRLVREDDVAPALAPIPGEAIHTTIDLPLQRYIDSMWQADLPGVRGAMVALTPTGEVLALYSAPSYDPNEFVGGISTIEWRRLNDDPARPLLDRAIQTRYPPASPFKLAIAAMALKRGVATFSTHMPEPCRGGLQVGNRYFRCWKPEGHGSLDLEGAIAKSCDVYFYQLGLRLGLDAILTDGVLMGFRDKSGIDLENEIAPIYPSNTAYFDRKYGPRGWSKWGATLNFAIGQGENTQNVIDMTRFYAALASGGDGADALHRPPAERPGALARPHAGTAGGAPQGADRGGRDGHRLREPEPRPGDRRQDRDGAELARRGPRLVRRLRAGGQADDHRGQHHGVCAARLDRGAVRDQGAAPVCRRAHRRLAATHHSPCRLRTAGGADRSRYGPAGGSDGR